MRTTTTNPLMSLSLAALLFGCSEGGPLPTQATPDIAAPAMAKGGGSKPASDVPVISTVAVDPIFQIRSDGLGPYVNSSTLISNVLGSLGDWILGSYFANGGTRTIYLDFSRPADGGPANPIPSGNYIFHMISKCRLNGHHFLTIPVGSTAQCPLRIGQIMIDGVPHGITMNPGTTTNDSEWPGTDYANVTCNAATAGACSSWTITPSGTAPDGSAANIAALNRTVTKTINKKRVQVTELVGLFHMSFRIDAVRQ